jgi:NADPH2:quinone reductase
VIAAVCREFGPPESLSLDELPTPTVADDEVLIEVGAAAVNFPDNLIIRGEYQVKPPMPFVPGFEVAGVVSAVGADVEFRVGDRVMALTKGGSGGYAQLALAQRHATELVPEGMDLVAATAFYSSYATSYHALVQRGRLADGETLVVLGAGGGIGLAAVELGKCLGARVVAVAGSPEKLAAARAHGADELVDYRRQDLRGAILELTDGRGADVCLDAVGGDAFDAMSRVMARGGRLLVLGFASGRIPVLPVNLLLLKGYEVVGVYWNNFVLDETALKRRNAAHLAQLWREGRLRPLVSATYPLHRVAQALHDIAGRDVIGKLVVSLEGVADE